MDKRKKKKAGRQRRIEWMNEWKERRRRLGNVRQRNEAKKHSCSSQFSQTNFTTGTVLLVIIVVVVVVIVFFVVACCCHNKQKRIF